MSPEQNSDLMAPLSLRGLKRKLKNSINGTASSSSSGKARVGGRGRASVKAENLQSDRKASLKSKSHVPDMIENNNKLKAWDDLAPMAMPLRYHPQNIPVSRFTLHRQAKIIFYKEYRRIKLRHVNHLVSVSDSESDSVSVSDSDDDDDDDSDDDQ